VKAPRCVRRAPIGLSSVCIEAICRAFSIPSGPFCLMGLFCGYNDLQEGFEGLWNTWLGIGIGIWDSSAAWSGVCRALARARRTYSSSFVPDQCAARSYISEARGETVRKVSDVSAVKVGCPPAPPAFSATPHRHCDRLCLQSGHYRQPLNLYPLQTGKT
jgi:hypothetical protein